MINQFRHLNPINLVLLAVIAFVLRAGVILSLPDSLDFSPFAPYASLLIDVPDGFFSPLSNVVIAIIIVLLQAILLNRIVNNYNLLGKPSFMPALMYVTASAILEPFVVLSPVLIANFLVLWMIDKFLSIYRKERVLPVLFDLGMITAVGTLIYFPFIAMLLLLWVSLVVLRPFNWREWVAGFIGFLTVSFFVASIYYLTDSLDRFFKSVTLATSFHTGFHVNPHDYIVLLPVLLVLVLSAFNLRQKLNRSNVLVRKSYIILQFLLLFPFLSFYLNTDYNIYHFLMAMPSLAIFMALFFIDSTKRWLYESLYLILAAFIIYFQFV